MSPYRSIRPLVALLGAVVGAAVMIAVIMPSSVQAKPSGPGNAPILLVVNSAAPNKFGAYLGEILRAEGLNEFDQIELSSLTAVSQLTPYDVVILAETPLNASQASLLNTYVTADGGALLAMRPDAQIAGLFGLSANVVTVTNGYLQISNSATFNAGKPGAGLASATLQIHGDADEYTTQAGAVTLAQLYLSATTSTPYPAVVAANSGNGQAVAFMYDLPSNVAYTRQGNPDNANIDVDNDYVVRTVDLFQTIGNPDAPWVDRDKIPIPQADEQQRLFARLVQQLVSRNHPLPQLWYFPGTAKTMLILTSDAHWDSNAPSDWQNLLADVTAYLGRITIYWSTGYWSNGQMDWNWPSETDLNTWEAQGHTFGIHPWITDTVVPAFDLVANWFNTNYPSVPRSQTTRIHQLAWQGWTEMADTEAAYNIGMDFSFYHWGPWLQKSDGTWPHGYITGSGLPMRFVRADGTIAPVFQQLTEMTDDQLFSGLGGYEGLTGAQAIALSQSLIDASLAGYYSALTDIHHVDKYSSYSETPIWLAGDLNYAVSKGVPIWNADNWLKFTQVRHDANFTNLTWAPVGKVLGFTVEMTATPGLTPTIILPANYTGNGLSSVTVDGNAYPYSGQVIKSTSVAFVSIPAGNHAVTATYAGPPTAVTVQTFGAHADNARGEVIRLALLALLLAIMAVAAGRWQRHRRGYDRGLEK